MRRATIQRRAKGEPLFRISIHALHEESDSKRSNVFRPDVISIHALHEESDARRSQQNDTASKFQSTLSMRRATIGSSNGLPGAVFQSTLSMRRATSAFHDAITSGAFQSTLSMRRATDGKPAAHQTVRDFNPRPP